MALATAPADASPSRVGGRGRLLVAAAVVLLAHLPLLVAHGQRLWAAPQYQFFPLLFVAAGLLAWRDWPRDAALAPGSALPFVAAWGVLAASIVLFFAWGAMLAVLLTLAAGCVARGGWPLLRRVAPAGLMLALLLPLPARLEQPLLRQMQALATRAAGPALDALHVPHLASGTVIAGPQKTFFIQEACSGIDVEVRLEKPGGDPGHAYLFYRMTDGAGRPIEPAADVPPWGGAAAFVRGLEDRAGRLGALARRGTAAAPTRPLSYQEQLFVTSERRLSDGQLEPARDLFRRAGDALAAAVSKLSPHE
jgi:hypothetical protein